MILATRYVSRLPPVSLNLRVKRKGSRHTFEALKNSQVKTLKLANKLGRVFEHHVLPVDVVAQLRDGSCQVDDEPSGQPAEGVVATEECARCTRRRLRFTRRPQDGRRWRGLLEA